MVFSRVLMLFGEVLQNGVLQGVFGILRGFRVQRVLFWALVFQAIKGLLLFLLSRRFWGK